MSFNKSFLLGYIGQKPSIKSTDKFSVCIFTIATSETWLDKEKKRNTSTEWHNIKVWGKLAEICSEHLDKGDQVFIEGQNCIDVTENKDGSKSYYHYVKLKEIKFIKVKSFSDSLKNNLLNSNNTSHNPNGNLTTLSGDDYQIVSDFTTDEIPF